jgi:uncharacterized protein (DUF2267 family)
MPILGIAQIDHAPHVLDQWLAEICDDLGWTEKRLAYVLLRETLHGLRDLLTVQEAADLAAQLPILVRGLYYEGWSPATALPKPEVKSALIARVSDSADPQERRQTERAIAAVLAVLRRHVPPDDITQIQQAMRRQIATRLH